MEVIFPFIFALVIITIAFDVIYYLFKKINKSDIDPKAQDTMNFIVSCFSPGVGYI